jgi:septal ring factor EnvC (AmiA/AmiB activator)
MTFCHRPTWVSVARIVATAAMLSGAADSRAWAQSPKPADAPPAKDLLLRAPEERPALTRDQLKTCMKQATELHELQPRLDKINAEIDEKQKKLDIESNEIKTAQRQLNRADRAAVARLNARIDDYNALLNKLSAEANSTDPTFLQGRRLRQAYNSGCAGLVFAMTDEASLIAELGIKENPMRRLLAGEPNTRPSTPQPR